MIIIFVTYVQKDFEFRTLIMQLIDKISNFHEIDPNFPYSQGSNFSSIIGN